MATRTIAVKMTLDAGQTVSEVEKVEKGLGGVNQQIDDIATSSKQIKTLDDRFKELNKSVASGELSQRQLAKAVKEYMTIAIQAGSNSPIGKAALQEAGQLKDKLSDLAATVTNLSKDGRGLQTALQLGQGVLGGYSAFQGIAALVGSENENLTKTIMKLQAAQSALMGIESLHASLQKETLLRKKLDSYWTGIQTTATAAYTFVVGTSTGALKLFKIALISTGIGALIVGIGLLIANFDAVVGAIKSAANALLGFFGFIDVEQQAAEEQTTKATAALKQQSAQRLKDIDALREKEAAAFTARQKAFDLDIARAEAEGKSSRALRLSKLEDLIGETKDILEANTAKIQVWIDYYTQLAAMRGQSEEDFKASMLKQGVDLEALNTQAQAALQSNRDAVFSAETELISLKNQFRDQDKKASEQAASDKQKILDDQAKADKDAYDKRMALLMQEIAANQKAADELFNRRIAARDKLHELRVAESADEYDDLQLAHEQRIAALDETIPEEMALKLYYDELYLKEKEALAIAYDEADKERDEAEKQRKQDLGFEIANQAMETAKAINDFANQIGENRINRLEAQARQDLNVAGLTAQQKYAIELKLAEERDKILKRQFNRNKALQISEGIMSTASAVLKALASAPPPANFILAGLAGVAGAAQVAAIAAQKFEGSAANITPPSFSSGGGSTSSSSSSGGSSSESGDANTGVTNNVNPFLSKVVVVETDITDSVTKVAKMEEIATL